MDADWMDSPHDASSQSAPPPTSSTKPRNDLRGCANTLDILGALGKFGWWIFIAWVAITTLTGWFGLVGGAVIVGALIIAAAVSNNK